MHNRKIKKVTKETIRDFKGKFVKQELKNEVLTVLRKKGFVDDKINNSCFEAVYSELKSQNKFFYLEKGKKEKLFIR